MVLHNSIFNLNKGFMKYFITIFCVVLSYSSNAQTKFFTKTGKINFYSETIVEDIRATNTEVLSIIDTNNGDMAISILMNLFNFPKKLMQEHFNENYVESEKYPKSTFKGKILNFSNLNKKEALQTKVKGVLTIHGVSQEVLIPTVIKNKKGAIVMEGKFIVKLEDYKIKIPKIVIKKIAEEIEVSYSFTHLPYN